MRHAAALRYAAALLPALAALLSVCETAQAAPTGGQVVAGTGSVSQMGNTTTIRQTSNTLSLNWQTFDVASNEVVNFFQPSTAAIAVNRILGNSASEILGHLNANGQVWLINPNGILFGRTAQVNVGGLTASTLDVGDAAFGANLRTFSGPGTGSVVNQGSIHAADGGYVALLGTQVSNQGLISAQLGTVALGAGSTETLTFSGRQLIHLRVDQSTLNDLADNRQLIQADGGRVIMTAGAQDSLLASVVNNTGIVQARTVQNHGGTITLLAGMAAGQAKVGGTLDATASAGESGGSIETSGAAVSLAKGAKIDAGPGGSWRIDPENLTIDAAAASTIDTSLNGGTNVVEQTTSGAASGTGTQTAGLGDINVNAAIAWTNPAAALTLTAYNAVNVNATVNGAGAIVMQAGAGINVNASITAAGSVTMQAGTAINVGAPISAGQATLQAGTGNLTIASGASIAGVAGVTIGTGANFVNNAGASALSSTGNWLVYSTNPTLDTKDGLTPNFIQYAAAFQATPAQVGGNGFLYSVAPSVTVTALTGTASKVYDGGTAATLTAANANYTLSGLLNGDTVNTMNATYQTVNAGSNIAVTSTSTVSDLSFTSASGLIPVYGYALSGSPVTASIGTITAKPLSAAIVGIPSKVYDGTTTATLTSANYSISGFVAGQSATVNQPSSVVYGSASAGSPTITAMFANTNFVAGASTTLANYTLPTTATGPGTVSPAPLVVTGVLATNKTYDGGTTDMLDTSVAGLYGKIGNDVVSLVLGGTGIFSSANKGSNLAVAVSGFSLAGAQQADYQIIQPTGLTASIAAAPLTVTGVTTNSKIYDGTTTEQLTNTNAALSAAVVGDVSLTTTGASGAFSSKNVGTALPVITAGYALSGTNDSNYVLTQPSSLTANITPAQLTVTLVNNPTKPYNGTTTAALGASNFTVTGFASGEGATIPQTFLAEYDSANAGSRTVTATLTGPDYATTGGALLSNYIVPTSVTGSGTITQAPLLGSIVGYPTKVYDGNKSATLGSANYSFTGFLAGEGVTVTQPSGTYAFANAGAQPVSATLSTSNYAGTSGTVLSNYSLPTTVSGPGYITPAPLASMTIYAGITGVTKTYDGTNVATLNSSNYVLTGFVNGQGATVGQTVGSYATVNAGVQTVTASLAPADFTANSGTLLSDYTLPTVAYGFGTISPKALSVTIINDPTRVYNGSTVMVLASSNYSITGLVGSESAQINPSALINYGSANVGAQSITATLTPTAYTANGGTLMTNYVGASSAAGTGHITAAPLNVTGVYATNKVYDTTTADPLSGSQALAGIVGSDDVTLVGTAAGTFADIHVGTGKPVTVTGLSLGGTAQSNYTLQSITGLTAAITPAPLTILGAIANSKPYDGSNTATLNDGAAVLHGLLGLDTATLLDTGVQSTFASVNVGTGLKVSTSGFTITGGQSSDYALTQPSGLTADIYKATVTATIIGDPTKVYDGSASTTLTSANYSLGGFATIGGVPQGASVPQSATATYGSPDAGVGVAIGSTLVLSDFIANSGTNLSNYQMPTTGSGTGTITQAPLSVSIIGKPTKIYDTTNSATLTSANYALSGFVTGQSTSVTQASGVYASANAGSQSVTATLAPGDYAVVSGTNLANYALPGSATGTGKITPVPLTVSVSTTGRPYDGTTVDALSGATLSLTGVYSGDAPALTASSSMTGTLGNSGNAGTDTVTTAFALTGTNSGNYIVTQPSGLTAAISQVQLSAAPFNLTKVYDGTDAANLSGTHTTVTGFISGQGASVNSTGVTGTFASPNVNTGITVTGPALLAGNLTVTGSTLLSNYLLPTSDDGTGTITLKALTYTATPSSQQYGLTPTGLMGTLTGFVNGETQTSDTSAGSMSGTMVFATTATASSNIGHYAIDGSGLTASNYSFTQASTNGTALTITPAPLTVTGVLTNSRPYNGSPIDALSGATLSGTIYNSDSPALTNTATGTLANSGNVGTDAVTTSMGLSGTGSGNYTLTQETPLGAVISSATLTAISTVSKTYDGTATASLSGGNTVFSGFAVGQGATVNAGVTGTFASPNAGSGIVVTGGPLTFANLTPSGGWVSGDYVLPGTDNGTGTISAAVVNLSGTRVYDAGLDAAATIFGTGGTLATGVGAETLTLSGSTTLLAKNVGSEGLSTLNGLTLANHGTGSNAGVANNYTLVGGTDAVTVTAATLTYNANAVSQRYGVTPVGLTGTVTGFAGSDSLANATTGAAGFTTAATASSNVNTYAINGAGLTALHGNYTFAQAAANATALSITPAVVNLSGTRVYDALTDANFGILSTNGTVSGVNGQTLTLSGSGTLLAKNVGPENVTNLGSLSLATGSGGNPGVANNYTLVGGTDTVTVTPLAITVTGTAPNKTYDGTTAATVATFGSGGVLANDVVTFAHTAASFNSANVASATTVTIPGITVSGTDAGNYTLNNTTTTAPAVITPAVVNLSGTRVYDALTDANFGILSTNGAVSGVNGQTLTLSGSGTLLAKNVGPENVTNLGNLSLATGSGGNPGVANNYTLVGGTDTVTVMPLAITVTGTAPNKTYDGTTAATVATFGSGGVLANDVVTFAHTAASFNSANVASATTVTIPGITVSGTDAGNYTLIDTTTTAPAVITPAVVNLSGTRVYDADLDAAAGIFGSVGVLTTGVGSETLSLTGSTTLLAKNVGSEGLSTLTGLSLANHGTGSSTGAASNYTLVGGTDTVNVTPAVVNLSGTRVYDAGLDAAAGIFGTSGTVPTGVNGETLGLSGSGTLAAKNVGLETVSPTGLSLANGTGGSAGLARNYTLVGGIDAVNVTPLGITVSGTGTNKVYDGTVADVVTLAGTGVLATDSVNFADTAAVFADKNVGTAKTVSISGITASGADAGNYTVNSTASTTATITPASLTESALPVTVAVGQTPTLAGGVSGFVPGDTLANATDGTLVWVTNAPVNAAAGTYAIDGAGLTAGNYGIAQAPGNAAALDVTAVPTGPVVTARVDGMVGLPLGPDAIATPYGVGSDNTQGNNTGNARRDKDPRDGNRHLADFTGRLALTLVEGGVRLPAPPAR